MALREIGATLKLDGEAAFKKGLNGAKREISNLNAELKLSQAEFDGQANSAEALGKKLTLLKQKEEQQKEIVEKLAQAVEDAADVYGEADKRTDDLRRQYADAQTQLAKLNREIKDNEKYLSEAEKAADGCATSIDGYGKKVKASAEQTKPAAANSNLLNTALGKVNVTGMASAAVFGKLAQGVKNALERIMQMVDETNELRTRLAMLEATAENAGVAMGGELRDSLIDLKTVTGDWDSAAETLTNLYAAGITGGKDFDEMLAYIEGAAIKFSDTIKAESFADSLQESLAVGSATGQFSEFLERCGVDIDKFNERLGDADTSAERLRVAYDALADTGIKAVADSYYEANAALVDYEKAQSRLELAKTDLASLFVPLKAAWTEAKAYMTEGLTDLMLHGFGGGLILQSLAKNAGTTFDEMESYLRTNQISWVEWRQAVKESGMEADEYWEHIHQLADAEAEFAAAHEAALATLSATGASVDEALSTLEELQAEYDSIHSSISGAVSGFTNMDAAMANYSVSADDMLAALHSQAEYLKKYQENFQTLVDAGFSQQLLAQWEDGSAQSAAQVQAVVDALNAGGDAIVEEMNMAYAEVDNLATSLADTFIASRPELMSALGDAAGVIENGVEEWNKYDEAYNEGQATIDGFISGMGSKASEILAKAQYLGGLASSKLTAYGSTADGYHAAGLSYVPYDGYVAELHRGEQVLTARQATAYRSGGGGRSVVVNVTAPSLNQSQVDYLVARVNRELGSAV